MIRNSLSGTCGYRPASRWFWWRPTCQANVNAKTLTRITRASSLAKTYRIPSGAGHANTVVVGDMNMNPFQDGMVSAAGLHGAMTRRLARRNDRVVHGRRYPFFYNPMWRFLGEREIDRPAGTCYYRRSDMITTFWHVFDQVLVRPALLDRFPEESVQVVTEVGNISLSQKSGLPGHGGTPDHLPITFSINI